MSQMLPTRPIELYCLKEDQTWYTVMVHIPATTHESKIAEVAFAVADKKFGPAAWAIYNTYDDDIPKVDGAFIVDCLVPARCIQRFLVIGCADEEQALEKMGTGDREQYGPDEILSWLGAKDDEYNVRPF